jgi:hypothetical protein
VKVLMSDHADHDFGGHFPGLDNPPAMIADLRDIGRYWTY